MSNDFAKQLCTQFSGVIAGVFLKRLTYVCSRMTNKKPIRCRRWRVSRVACRENQQRHDSYAYSWSLVLKPHSSFNATMGISIWHWWLQTEMALFSSNLYYNYVYVRTSFRAMCDRTKTTEPVFRPAQSSDLLTNDQCQERNLMSSKTRETGIK